MALNQGELFGTYEIGEPIGAGGMGEVWRARDTTLKRDVALKVLPAAFVADAERLARFRREAEILASLNHVNIAQVFGLETIDGQTAIVMELVEGPTLADRISEGPILPDEAMAIASQIIAALEAAHASQIVHRDLKPANIKLTADGTVKVLDFGISKSLDPAAISGGAPAMTTPAMTQTGIILGTAAYMSPEQARGKFVDQRTDIWAFGCVLFEMLTGQPAFGGEDVMLTLARVLDRDTDLSSIPKTISPAARHTLKLCLEKDARRRIADIRDVRLALEGKFETEFPGEAPNLARVPLWKRAALPAVALVVGGLAVGAVVWAMLQPEPPRITRFVDVLPADTAFNSIGNINLAISPAGDAIAYGANGALYVRELADLTPRRLEQTAIDNPTHPVFSPDGEWIAYWSEGRGELRKVAIQGGSPVTITKMTENPYGPRWTPDDVIVYGRGGQAVEVPASGAQEPTLLFDTGSSVPVVSAYLLPGGRTLLYTDGGNANGYVVDLGTGEKRLLISNAQQMQYVASGHLVYFDVGSGSLTARTFDPETLEFGGPVSLVDDVQRPLNAAVQLALSPTGTLAYIEGASGVIAEAGTSLAIVDSDGNVRPLDVPRRAYAFPSISPDGMRVAVQVNEDDEHSNIFIYDLSGRSEIRQLTFAGIQNRAPDWKDAETVVFTSDRDGSMRIYEQRVDGGTAVALTEPVEGEIHLLPAITPEGRLAYSVNPGTIATRSRVLSSDGEPEAFVNDDAPAGAVVFSPDGTLMAYNGIGANTVQFSIFVERYPSDGSKRLASSADQVALFPRWARNGVDSPLTLVYQEPARGILQAVDISLPGLEFGNRRMLFPYAGTRANRQFDSIPGTDSFIVNWIEGLGIGAQANASEPDRIVVIQNWIEELKARVRTD